MAIVFDEHECAFCLSEVPHGATVCAHCGAYKGTKKETKRLFLRLIIIGILVAAFGVFGLANSENGLETVEFIAISAAGFGLAYLTIWDGMKPCWLRRN